MTHLEISTTRTGYSVKQCGKTLTVGELIDILSMYDEETPVYFNNNNGYTFGEIVAENIDEVQSEEEEI